jgi:hypothetical protein
VGEAVGRYTPPGGFVFQRTGRAMSDFCTIKRLDGCPAIFLRFYGPDYFVIEVDRVERIVSKAIWANLPPLDATFPDASTAKIS